MRPDKQVMEKLPFLSLPANNLTVLGEFSNFVLIPSQDFKDCDVRCYDLGLDDVQLMELRAACINLRREGVNPNVVRSNVGGYHSSHNLFNDIIVDGGGSSGGDSNGKPIGHEPRKIFASLQQKIWPLVKEQWNKKRSRDKEFPLAQFKPPEAWANIMERDNYHAMHDHSGASYSGVVYLGNHCTAAATTKEGKKNSKCECDSECECEHEGAFTVFRTAVNGNTCEYFALPPTVGSVALWPSDMVHAVTKLKQSSTRVTVSFNFFLGSAAPRYC